MSAIDELLIAVGIEEGSTLEELYSMLKDIQSAGGTIKIKFQEDLPTRGQVTNVYRRISELENKILPQLNKFPELIDKIKEYIVDVYEGLKEQCVKDEVQRIDDIVRAILNKLPVYKRDITTNLNKIAEEIQNLLKGQEKIPEEIIRTEIIRKIFKTEIPENLPIIDPMTGKTVVDSLLQQVIDILVKGLPIKEELDKWTTGPGTEIGRGATAEQRIKFGKLFGVDWPGWKEGMEPLRKIIEDKIYPVLHSTIDDPGSVIRKILTDAIKKLDENVNYSNRLLHTLRAGFQTTKQFETTISQQITLMDGRIKYIQDKVSRENPEEKNLRKDKKGKLE